MFRSVSGTCPEALLTARRFRSWASSIFLCTYLVNQNINGSNISNNIASPLFLNHITARILIILHVSANILTIPEVNRFSTVSTSPTNLDTTAPGSCLLNDDAVSLVKCSIRPLRRACVIFWPNTVRSPSLAASIRPVITLNTI